MFTIEVMISHLDWFRQFHFTKCGTLDLIAVIVQRSINLFINKVMWRLIKRFAVVVNFTIEIGATMLGRVVQPTIAYPRKLTNILSLLLHNFTILIRKTLVLDSALHHRKNRVPSFLALTSCLKPHIISNTSNFTSNKINRKGRGSRTNKQKRRIKTLRII